MCHVLVPGTVQMLRTQSWKLTPIPLPHLPHVRILLWRSRVVVRMVFDITTIKPEDRKTAAHQGAGSKYDEEDDQTWGELKAHIVSLLDVHGGYYVIASACGMSSRNRRERRISCGRGLEIYLSLQLITGFPYGLNGLRGSSGSRGLSGRIASG